MKRLLLSITFIALVCVSCQKEDTVRVDIAAPVFTAIIESETDTKTVITADRKVYWESTDVISINGVRYDAIPDETNAVSATFVKNDSEDAPSAPYYAYYPYDLYDGTTASLPAVQSYSAGELNAPMYAESSNTSLSFKNICSLLAVSVKQSEMSEIQTIRVSSSNKALCGDFTVDPDSYYAELTNPNDTDKKVILDCGTSKVTTSETGTVFYIAIPPQIYRELKIELSADGLTYTKAMTTTAGTEITIKRNKIYSVEFHNDPPAVPVTSVSLDDKSLYLSVGDTYRFPVSVLPEEASNKTLTWISEDESIASFAEDGTLTAHSEGECIIKAIAHNGITARCTVSVTPANSDFWLYLISGYDSDEDGILNTEEIGMIDSLNVSTQNFTEMAELPRLSNLRKLNAANQPVTSLDISKNQNLIWVYAMNCNALQTISVKSLTYGPCLYFSKTLNLQHGDDISTVVSTGRTLFIPASSPQLRIAINLNISITGTYYDSDVSLELAEYLISRNDDYSELLDLAGQTYMKNFTFITNETCWTTYIVVRTFTLSGTYGYCNLNTYGNLLGFEYVN